MKTTSVMHLQKPKCAAQWCHLSKRYEATPITQASYLVTLKTSLVLCYTSSHSRHYQDVNTTVLKVRTGMKCCPQIQALCHHMSVMFLSTFQPINSRYYITWTVPGSKHEGCLHENNTLEVEKRCMLNSKVTKQIL